MLKWSNYAQSVDQGDQSYKYFNILKLVGLVCIKNLFRMLFTNFFIT